MEFAGAPGRKFAKVRPHRLEGRRSGCHLQISAQKIPEIRGSQQVLLQKKEAKTAGALPEMRRPLHLPFPNLQSLLGSRKTATFGGPKPLRSWQGTWETNQQARPNSFTLLLCCTAAKRAKGWIAQGCSTMSPTPTWCLPDKG